MNKKKVDEILHQMETDDAMVVKYFAALLRDALAMPSDKPSMAKALHEIHEVLEDYVAHKIEETSLCLRIKNIINNALLPHLLEDEVEAVKLVDGFATTMPALAMASSESPYGGVTGRPRRLKGYIRLPDGRRFYLGEIGIKFDGWGDGLLTEVNMIIHASACEETE